MLQHVGLIHYTKNSFGPRSETHQTLGPHILGPRPPPTDRNRPYGEYRTGPQKPEQDWEWIFEPYERADDVPGLAPSSGLGLRISGNLTRLERGELIFRHQDGEGVFEFTLSLADEPDTT